MALPYRIQFTVFDGIAATTTAPFPPKGAGLPEYAHSVLLEVLGGASANFTLAIQGKTHTDGTFTAIDYVEVGQAGAAALANSTLTVNDQTNRFYLIPNAFPFMQLIATRTAGSLTVRGSYSGEAMSQFLTTTASGGLEVSGNTLHDAVYPDFPVNIGAYATEDVQSITDVAEGDLTRLLGTLKGRLIGTQTKGLISTADGLAAGFTMISVMGEDDVDYRNTVQNVPLGLGPDGAFDRQRSAGDAADSGLGMLLASPAGHRYDLVAADEQILGAAGKLHTITIHDISTGGVITVYDSLTETGTVIATLTLAAGEGFVTLHYDVSCLTGLFIGFDGSVVGTITVSSAI